jgi:hypothetical protein
VGTATITFPDKGDEFGQLLQAMGVCLKRFCVDLTAGQVKSLNEKAVTVVNLAKTNMKFWTDELRAVLAATNKKELLTAVTTQRSAPKASDTVLQFCALLISVTNSDADTEAFLKVITDMENPSMAIAALTMFGKFPLPSMPKAKDAGMLYVNERGEKLEMKKLTDCKESDIILVNDGAIVAEGQVLQLLSASTTVYAKPPGADVFFKGKGKHAKYERREWNSMEAKPVLNLVKMLVAGGMKITEEKKGGDVAELNPADEVDED